MVIFTERLEHVFCVFSTFKGGLSIICSHKCVFIFFCYI